MHGFYYDWKKTADERRDTIRSLDERILEGKARMNAYKERLAESDREGICGRAVKRG